MKSLTIALSFIFVVTGLALAQQANKSWLDLTAKEAEKILNSSAWGQTQTDTNTSEMMFTPTAPSSANSGNSRGIRGAGSVTLAGDVANNNQNRASEGAYNQAVNINYRVRFFSAKPIREALARTIFLQQDPANRELIIPQMQSLVERNFDPWIVVIVDFDSANDGRLTGKAIQDFASATTDTLRNSTYLERNDGKRIFLLDYRAPSGDGLGAKFVFPRQVNGKPLLTEEHTSIRFYSEVGANVRLSRPFKVREMMYQGKLEY
jgi:hypothetical protein